MDSKKKSSGLLIPKGRALLQAVACSVHDRIVKPLLTISRMSYYSLIFFLCFLVLQYTAWLSAFVRRRHHISPVILLQRSLLGSRSAYMLDYRVSHVLFLSFVFSLSQSRSLSLCFDGAVDTPSSLSFTRLGSTRLVYQLSEYLAIFYAPPLCSKPPVTQK